MNTKVLITGGAGFIGSHLANFLIGEGFRVKVVDNLSHGSAKNLNKNVDFTKTDIRKREFITFVKKLRPEYIFHFAADSNLQSSIKSPKRVFETNFYPIIPILEVTKNSNLKKFIFSSSAAVYSPSTASQIAENAKKIPTSMYGLSKLLAEEYLEYFSKKHKTPYTTLRFSNVYGPKQDSTAEGGVVAIFIKKLLSQKPVTIFGDGSQTRDFIYVDDVINACDLALKKDFVGIFNVSTGKSTSINNLFNALKKLSGSYVKRVNKSMDFFEVKDSALNNGKFNKKTGWYAQKSLTQGLKLTLEYFKQNP